MVARGGGLEVVQRDWATMGLAVVLVADETEVATEDLMEGEVEEASRA